MSPDESISPTNSGKEYSLTEIHARLVRSPPPICWPVSPRSNGTFSPDSRYAYYLLYYIFSNSTTIRYHSFITFQFHLEQKYLS